MVELGESIVREKCISQDELAQIDRHRQKTIFFLQEQLSSLSRIYGGTLSGGGIYGGHSLTDISTFGDGQAGRVHRAWQRYILGRTCPDWPPSLEFDFSSSRKHLSSVTYAKYYKKLIQEKYYKKLQQKTTKKYMHPWIQPSFYASIYPFVHQS